jgi:myosin-1
LPNTADATATANALHRYLGLVENVRVRRAGYCFRESHKDFFWRYKCLSEKTYPRWGQSDIEGCITVMQDLGIGPGAYQVGTTKIFIKNPATVFTLEEARDDKIDEIVTRLQVAYRLYRIRKEIRTYYDALVVLFKDVKTDPSFGRRIVWPKHGPILNSAETFLKRVFETWWARMLVGRLDKDQRNLWRMQLLAHRFLSGKKQVWWLVDVGDAVVVDSGW